MDALHHMAPKRSGHTVVQRLVREWVTSYHVVDQENVDPRSFQQSGVVLLQMRDLLNWTASYVMLLARRQGIPPEQVPPTRVVHGFRALYYPIMKEYYSVTQHLSSQVVRVYYDDFISSRRYRELICLRLGGTYRERSLSRVDENGGGSSFTGQALDGQAHLMEVLTRYRQLPTACAETVRCVLGVPGVLELYLKYQCDSADKKEFLDQLTNILV